MNSEQRKRYFGDLWPAACRANNWSRSDDAQRRAVTLQALGTASTTGLDENQITALFCYLRHLGNPQDAALEREWAICKADPAKYNRLRHAEFWRQQSGYKHGGKLDRERFGVHFDEEVQAEHMTAAEVEKYLLTQRSRAKGFRQKKSPKREKTAQPAKPTKSRRWHPAPTTADCPF